VIEWVLIPDEFLSPLCKKFIVRKLKERTIGWKSLISNNKFGYLNTAIKKTLTLMKYLFNLLS